MPDDRDTTPQWQKETVVEEMRRQALPDRPPTAQVFLEASVEVDSNSMEEFARKMVEDAAAKSHTQAAESHIGKLHPLAKSFSVTADPEVFAEIAKSPSVKSILPSEIHDIYPKPFESD
ncbi:hypothetical protein [Anderseniella sp. Alg231-50]|uniref:hypothetical protein n=1 Tax=Anderseniella sp. Alg231-50 TaxID=1922226 RepID=UPI00307C07DC